MQQYLGLKNQFLIAMPQLSDPRFSHTVTYVVNHTADGAMGFIINRPSPSSFGDMFKKYKIEPYPGFNQTTPIYNGGPLQPDRGFILHSNDRINWSNTVKITDDFSVTASKDVLEAIAMGVGPNQYLFTLGYTSWSEQQVEQEMAANTWLTVPMDENVMFNLPSELRWQAAGLQVGIDIHLMPQHAGHA